MTKYKKEFFLGFVFLLLFFFVETFSRDEIILTILVICFGVIFLRLPNEQKVKSWLFIIGLVLGTLIEVVMGFWGRSQYWSYGNFFGVPLWLPFIWGLGFEVIYVLGKFISDITKK